MEEFAALIRELDSTNKTTVKVAALTRYFQRVPNKDKVWAIAILSHRRPPRPVNTTLLRHLLPNSLIFRCGCLKNPIILWEIWLKLLLWSFRRQKRISEKSLTQYLEEIIDLKSATEAEKKEYLHENWAALNYYERFVFTKLITGSFRIGVSQKLMTRALSKATDIDEDVLAYKLMGDWDPQKITFQKLILEENEEDFLSKPYPFYLAYAIEGEPGDLGDPAEWSAEHKWDGISSQVVIRNGEIFVWSRGEELVTDKYPEFSAFLELIPDGTVIDGEILPFPEGEIGTFNDLQTRIGRKNVSKALAEEDSGNFKSL